MPDWSAFVGLTAVVVVLLLVLARLSSDAIYELDSPADAESVDGTDRTPIPDESDRTLTSDDPPRTPTADESEPFASSSDASEPEDVPHSAAIGGRSPASEVDADPGHRTDSEPIEFGSGAMLVNVALSHGLFGGVIVAAAWYWAIPSDALGIGPGVPIGGPVVGVYPVAGVDAVALGIVAGIALYLANEAMAALADASGIEYSETLRELLAPESGRGWVVLLGGSLPIVAVVEELLFRAAAIGVVAAGFGLSPWALAVVSSIAFGFGHGAQGRAGVLVTAVLGFALAALFVATWSLLVVVVAHYVVNALEFVVHEGLELDPKTAVPGISR